VTDDVAVGVNVAVTALVGNTVPTVGVAVAARVGPLVGLIATLVTALAIGDAVRVGVDWLAAPLPGWFGP
jgi:hypothetical protein